MNYQQLWRQLAQVYGDGEAQALARMVYEERFGLTLSDIYLGKDTQLSADDQTELEEIARRLLQQEPVQYVLGRATFCGRPFAVTPSVLIPRPETEELCQWMVSEVRDRLSAVSDPSILDVGTGSGCIAITLAAELPQARVTAWDIADDALQVARQNALRNHAQVSFQQVDALNITPFPHLPTPASLHLIVSNPPYICNKERAKMESNVLEHEPHMALFVPDDDPLLFYRAIAAYGQTALCAGGWLYFEINPLYATALCDMLSVMSYHAIEVREEQYGKQRMVRACR